MDGPQNVFKKVTRLEGPERLSIAVQQESVELQRSSMHFKRGAATHM